MTGRRSEAVRHGRAAVIGAVALAVVCVPCALAGEVTWEQLLELADSNVDVELVVSLVEADCVDFELDAETLLELSSRIDKPIIQAIFDCKAGDGPPATEPAEGPTPEATAMPLDVAPRLLRELRAESDRKSGYLELHTDRLVWSRKKPDEGSDPRRVVVTYDDVIEFQPTVSHRRKRPDRNRRGGLFVRIADGRGQSFDPLSDPDGRPGDDYSPDDALQLAEKLNRYVESYRKARGLTPDVYEWKDLSVRVRSDKDGTFSFSGDRIEFVPDKDAARARYGFSILFSRVSEVRIGGWGEAAVRFERTRPLVDGERIDLDVRKGWISLYGWEGKGVIRELENRGIEIEFE